MRNLICLFFLLEFLSGPIFAQTIQVTRETIIKNSRTRYEPPEILENRPASEVFKQRVFTGDRSILYGLGRKTAEELSLTNALGYNEYQYRCDGKDPEKSTAAPVRLHAKAVLFYDTASLEPLYLDGCICGGKPWINRFTQVKRDLAIQKDGTETATFGRFHFTVSFQTLGNASQNDVTLRDILPQGLRYVTGSIQGIPTGVAEIDLFQKGINYGTMKENQTATVEFDAEVIDRNLAPGTHPFTNVATVVSREVTERRDDAIVSLSIRPPDLSAACVQVTVGQVGLSYYSRIVVAGGTAPFIFALAPGSGPLPPGLKLDPNTGDVSGTPTTAGTFGFRVVVTDSTGGTALTYTTPNCSVTIQNPVVKEDCPKCREPEPCPQFDFDFSSSFAARTPLVILTKPKKALQFGLSVGGGAALGAALSSKGNRGTGAWQGAALSAAVWTVTNAFKPGADRVEVDAKRLQGGQMALIPYTFNNEPRTGLVKWEGNYVNFYMVLEDKRELICNREKVPEHWILTPAPVVRRGVPASAAVSPEKGRFTPPVNANSGR